MLDDEQLRQVDDLTKSTSSPDSELSRYLAARRYLFHSEQEERREYLLLREKLRVAEARERTVFAVCPTYSCFFKCKYCYEGELTAGGHVALFGAREILAGMEQMEHLLRQEGSLYGRPYITLLGGEALQEATRPLVSALLAESLRRGYSLAIITNGFLLDTFLDELKRHAVALKYIQITLDGPAKIHDGRRPLTGGGQTFARVVSNIQKALDAGLPVRLRTNVDLNNIGSLIELAHIIEERGWTRRSNFKAYLAPVDDNTCRGHDLSREDELLRVWLPMRESPDWASLLRIYDDSKLFRVTDMLEANISGTRRVLPRFSYCAATKGKSFVFGPEGSIYQCLRGVGEARASIGTFWPTFEVEQSKMNRWRQRDITNIECEHCGAVAPLQGGGCALESLIREGNLNACSCGDAVQVISGYVEFRRGELLRQAREADVQLVSAVRAEQSDPKITAVPED